jgi:hypothetical protein
MKEARNGPAATPCSRTASERVYKGLPKRSDPASNFPARALLKDFEEEGEEEEEENDLREDGLELQSDTHSRKRSRNVEFVAEEEAAELKKHKPEGSTSSRRSSNAELNLDGSVLESIVARSRGCNTKPVELGATRSRGHRSTEPTVGQSRSTAPSKGHIAGFAMGGFHLRSLSEGGSKKESTATRSKKPTVGPKSSVSTRSHSADFSSASGQEDSRRGKSSVSRPKKRKPDSEFQAATESRKHKPSLESGLPKDSAHDSDAGPTEKFGSEVSWEDFARESNLESTDLAKNSLKEQQVSMAPRKQARRSSGYSSYHQDISDINNSVASNPVTSDGWCDSPHVTPTPSPLLPRPSQVRADEGITKSFADICQDLVSRSGKKVPAKEVPVKVEPRKNRNPMPQPNMENTRGRKKTAPPSPTLTQLSRVGS